MKLKNNSGSKLLGSFSGVVYAHLGRGKKIGFPTANVRLSQSFRHGVYISRALVGQTWHPSLTFIGIPSTFANDTEERAETHILEGNFDLVGKELRVELLQFVRNNQKFKTPGELIHAIQQDVLLAKSFFVA